MNLDTLLTAIVLLAGYFIIFIIGKLLHDLLRREYKINFELTERDNPALALAMVGYYLGLVLAVGGALVGESLSLMDSLLDLAIYGLLAVVLLNISWWVIDFLILRKFSIADELIRDQNQGTGAVVAGAYIASGFILFGAMSGEGGGVVTSIVYWALGQALLVIATFVYNLITPYDIHAEIEKDNVAAGVSFGGALAGIGILIGLAGQGDFTSWRISLMDYLGVAVVGLVMLPILRFLTDKLLLPGSKLSHEIANQETPNVGAAYVECFAYISGAFVFYWCV
jgi:uncharacterized membrane protein YjfL (UPF0719 family)